VTNSNPGAATRFDRRTAPAAVLRYAAAFYALALIFHTADHLRRGIDAVTPQVLASGAVSTTIAVVAIVLCFTRFRYAAILAIVAGFANAFGVAAVHLLPRWSAFSDAFPGGNVDLVSWVAAVLEIVAAGALGVAGVVALQRSRGPTLES
jgi:hypothetical protein